MNVFRVFFSYFANAHAFKNNLLLCIVQVFVGFLLLKHVIGQFMDL